MMNSLKKGFTLIELLVVITIIGILATGAVTTFTSQIQKARDTTRITDINAMKSAVEQVYQDTGEYPHSDTFFTEVSVYMERLPSDPKHAQPCNSVSPATAECAYAYIAGPDNNNILYGEYEISTAFENSWNRDNRAEWDSGNDDQRLEIGIDVGNNTSAVAADAVTAADGACAAGWAVAGNGTTLIIINGNPASGECS